MSISVLEPQVSVKSVNFVITPYMQEVINGSMLGDGCVSYTNNKTSARFVLNTACEQYSDYLLSQLPGFSQSLYEIKEYADNIYYRIEKGSKQFLAMREEWYPAQANGTAYKEVPFGLELTPTTVLHWYLGDGHKDINGYFIKLHTEGFKAKDVELLALKLSQAVGIGVKTYQVNKESANPYVSYKQVYISGKNNVAKFLEYIGECPFAQYRHKWVNGLKAREAFNTPQVTDFVDVPKVKTPKRLKLVGTIDNPKTGTKAFKLYNVTSV